LAIETVLLLKLVNSRGGGWRSGGGAEPLTASLKEGEKIPQLAGE
jgi:hypothetical protein